jgi:hypothetical protein
MSGRRFAGKPSLKRPLVEREIAPFLSIRQVGTVAEHAERVLKGDIPGDPPLQQSTKVELTINLKAAKALGIAVPLSLTGPFR